MRRIIASSEASNKSLRWLHVTDEESWCYLLVLLVLLGRDAELTSQELSLVPILVWSFGFSFIR